jgi:hypothetical protein
MGWVVSHHSTGTNPVYVRGNNSNSTDGAVEVGVGETASDSPPAVYSGDVYGVSPTTIETAHVWEYL